MSHPLRRVNVDDDTEDDEVEDPLDFGPGSKTKANEPTGSDATTPRAATKVKKVVLTVVDSSLGPKPKNRFIEPASDDEVTAAFNSRVKVRGSTAQVYSTSLTSIPQDVHRAHMDKKGSKLPKPSALLKKSRHRSRSESPMRHRSASPPPRRSAAHQHPDCGRPRAATSRRGEYSALDSRRGCQSSPSYSRPTRERTALFTPESTPISRSPSPDRSRGSGSRHNQEARASRTETKKELKISAASRTKVTGEFNPTNHAYYKKHDPLLAECLDAAVFELRAFGWGVNAFASKAEMPGVMVAALKNASGDTFGRKGLCYVLSCHCQC